VIHNAAIDGGGVEFVFKDDTDVTSLEFRVLRIVEQHVKLQEIEGALKAVAKREERGYANGRPPYGYQYDENAEYKIPVEDEYQKARRVIRLLDDDEYTWADIADETGIPQGTIGNINRNRGRYSLPFADAQD